MASVVRRGASRWPVFHLVVFVLARACVGDALVLRARARSHTTVLLNHRADAFRSPRRQLPFSGLGYEFY
jgi:hypothetical protein